MIKKHEKYKIVICDDDNTFAELLCEKIRAELYGKKEEILVEKYMTVRSYWIISLWMMICIFWILTCLR